MQAKISKSPARTVSAVGWSPQNPVISASFSILSISYNNLEKLVMQISEPTNRSVSLEQTPEGENIISVDLPESSTGYAGFNLVFNIPDSETLGWIFTDPSGVFSRTNDSGISSGILISPALSTVFSVGFLCQVSPGEPPVNPPSYKFSLNVLRLSNGTIHSIDDPTVILKPPTEGK